MSLIGFVKGEFGYKKKVNEYRYNKIKNGECLKDEDDWVCNEKDKIKRKNIN